MPFYGSCNRSNRWLRNRIRCSRVALPPKASSGETAAGSFWDITLLGMTRFAQVARVPSPGPLAMPQSPGGVGALTARHRRQGDRVRPGLLHCICLKLAQLCRHHRPAITAAFGGRADNCLAGLLRYFELNRPTSFLLPNDCSIQGVPDGRQSLTWTATTSHPRSLLSIARFASSRTTGVSRYARPAA